MKQIHLKFLLIFLFLGAFSLQAQKLTQFNTERLKTTENLMLVYGGWSIANLTTSSIGWATTNYEAKYFHQMNVAWSVINLAIAVPSYIRGRKTEPNTFSFAETWKTQNKTEKVFLFNTAFDLTYVAAGFIMKTSADPLSKNYDRFQGYGNSFILQGSFLFLFDLAATIIHTKHRQNKLDSFWGQIDISNNGLGLKYTFPILELENTLEDRFIENGF